MSLSHRERIEKTIEGQPVDRPAVSLWRHFPVDDQTPEGQYYNFRIDSILISSRLHRPLHFALRIGESKINGKAIQKGPGDLHANRFKAKRIGQKLNQFR
jgi:hypothetical protein